MRTVRPLQVLSLAFAVAAAQCGKNTPTEPSGTPSSNGSSAVTASVAAPRAVTPAVNATMRNVDQPLTLTVQNAAVSRTVPVTYTFEVANDAAFSSRVYTKSGVAEGSGGQTSVAIDRLAAASEYYWHARAEGGGTTGPFSAMRKFTIGPAVVLNAPVAIGPLNGTRTGPRPALRVFNAPRQGPAGPITYRFEVSTTSAFTPTVVNVTQNEGVNETGYVPPIDLPLDVTLYWRATAIDAANGVTSPSSTVQSFTATNPSAAERIAIQQGVTLWPRGQPPGTPGKAVMGGGFEIQTLTSFTGVRFNSPTLEELQIFDLMDRGMSPDGAIGWLRSNGYSTTAVYYDNVKAIGFEWQYMALINGQWHLILRVGA